MITKLSNQLQNVHVYIIIRDTVCVCMYAYNYLYVNVCVRASVCKYVFGRMHIHMYIL